MVKDVQLLSPYVFALLDFGCQELVAKDQMTKLMSKGEIRLNWKVCLIYCGPTGTER